MKGAFPFAEAPAHRVMPGETRPRPDAWQAKTVSQTIPTIDSEHLSEDAIDALCMEAVEAAVDWRQRPQFS
ncbi:hypothetical protein [Martelella sp. AD-3]|uniref:hypothetical protein n=1 Tax=Martelella sp. AD-3 TaxID=686597 RepID=UPI000466D090|nr:hypothetical protein [Martelella sp. AD-3]AMM84033.1 hypothetical protein AZF01_06390 [Martelella sp. AD-3]